MIAKVCVVSVRYSRGTLSIRLAQAEVSQFAQCSTQSFGML